MKKISEPIVFFGNERLATGVQTTAPTLQALVVAGYRVAAVISNYETGQSRNARTLEIGTVADRYGIPVLLPTKLSDITEQLRSYDASLGVLVAYGKIVPQSVIDIFPFGIVNIHPSLLPLHRGPTPIESVILSGEAQTGVSIMKLTKEMDAGPVYSVQEVPLAGNESKQELSEKLLELGKDLLTAALPGIINGTLTPVPQDDKNATYDSLLSKGDGRIDWQKPAELIEREIRAYIEWPKSHARLAEREVIITKARVYERSGKPGTWELIDGQVVVYCKEKSLVLERLKPSGKKEMSGAEFARGYLINSSSNR